MLPPILQMVKDAGHQVFLRGAYNLNMVGLRNTRGTHSEFDDLLTLTYKEYPDGPWIVRAWPATTDPGRYFLENPLNTAGTAVMEPGQYRSAYMGGYHRGRRALVQVGPVRYRRDGDRDEDLDNDPGTVYEGNVALNIHDISNPSYMAGCQGVKPQHMEEILKIYGKAKMIWGPKISYTLLEV